MINRAAAISQRARAPRVLATMGPTPESYTNCLGVGSHTPRRINVGPGIGCSHSSGRTGQTWRFLSRLEERLGKSREVVRREIEELWMDAKPATGQLLRPASGSALKDFPGGLLLAGLHCAIVTNPFSNRHRARSHLDPPAPSRTRAWRGHRYAYRVGYPAFLASPRRGPATIS